LDLDQVDATLRADRSIRAVMPVHLYGHPLDPAALERLAAEHDVVVIEDCAQSAGAERDGKPTGLAGIAAGTSLYPTKNLGAMGDGGVLLTSDETIAEQARRLRNYGQGAQYEHVELGLNSRLDELHAAVLRSAMLPRLDRWLARRAEIASRYTKALRESRLRPVVAGGGHSAHHLFPVRVLDHDPKAIREQIVQRGVAVGRHYPLVCPDQPAVRGIGTIVGDLAVARRLAECELSLPIHPHLEDQEVEVVIEACLEICV
jgi:dTDP-4-amino-4,6-dideoxygalactose transaminase